MVLKSVAAAVIGMLLMSACDRLVLRDDRAILSSTLRAESQVNEIAKAIDQVMTKRGFREQSCVKTQALLCRSYANAERARVTATIDKNDPQTVHLNYEAFGNLRDRSAEIFSEIRAAIRAAP